MKRNRSRSKSWTRTLRGSRNSRLWPKIKKLTSNDSPKRSRQPSKKWKILKLILKMLLQNLKISCKEEKSKMKKKMKGKRKKRKNKHSKKPKKRGKLRSSWLEWPLRRLRKLQKKKRRLKKQKRIRLKLSLLFQWNRSSVKLKLEWITLTDQPH